LDSSNTSVALGGGGGDQAGGGGGMAGWVEGEETGRGILLRMGSMRALNAIKLSLSIKAFHSPVG